MMGLCTNEQILCCYSSRILLTISNLQSIITRDRVACFTYTCGITAECWTGSIIQLCFVLKQLTWKKITTQILKYNLH